MFLNISLINWHFHTFDLLLTAFTSEGWEAEYVVKMIKGFPGPNSTSERQQRSNGYAISFKNEQCETLKTKRISSNKTLIKTASVN